MIDAESFNAFEAAGWEGVAEGYDRFFGPITGRVVEPLLEAAGVGPGTRLLDLATGPGYVAARAAALSATAVGLDVADSMVALARRRHPEAEFVRGDAERLPFPDASFDAVVGNFMILHVGRPERAAAEAFRVLVPGGRLALSVWDVPQRARFVGVLVDAVGQAGATPPRDIPDGPPFFRFSVEDEFRSLLAAAGFEGVEVATVSFALRLREPDELWSGLLDGTVRTAALIRGQDEEKLLRIREAFARQVAEYAGADGLELPVSVKIASGDRPT